MAYDEELANRIRELMGEADDVVEKRMFGGIGFMVSGNLAIAASGQGGLLVRADPAESEALVARSGAEIAIMRGRPMTGWLRVGAEHVRTKRQLERWVRIGTRTARSLPSK